MEDGPAGESQPGPRVKRRMHSGSGTFGNPVITRVRGYFVAVIVTVVAVTASLPLQRTIDRFPYLPLLVAAVIVSAWAGGLGPGLLAASAGGVAAEYLVMGGGCRDSHDGVVASGTARRFRRRTFVSSSLRKEVLNQLSEKDQESHDARRTE